MCREYTIQEKKLMIQIKSMRKHVCEYCGKSILNKDELTIDHVIPHGRDGMTVESNLVISCLSCNQEKADMTKEEYEKYLVLKQNISVNNIGIKQFNILYETYNKMIENYKQITKEERCLIEERDELEKIIKDSKVNAADGYLLFRDLQTNLRQLEQKQIIKKSLWKSCDFATKNIESVRKAHVELIQSVIDRKSVV